MREIEIRRGHSRRCAAAIRTPPIRCSAVFWKLPPPRRFVSGRQRDGKPGGDVHEHVAVRPGIYWLDRARRSSPARLGRAVRQDGGQPGGLLSPPGRLRQSAGRYYQEAETAQPHVRQSARRADLARRHRTAQTGQGRLYRRPLKDFATRAARSRSRPGTRNRPAWWLSNLTLASISLGDFDAAERYNQQAAGLGRFQLERLVRRLHEAEIAAARQELDARKSYSARCSRGRRRIRRRVLDAEYGIGGSAGRNAATRTRADAEFRRP